MPGNGHQLGETFTVTNQKWGFVLPNLGLDPSGTRCQNARPMSRLNGPHGIEKKRLALERESDG
jgi:hypothetical protein